MQSLDFWLECWRDFGGMFLGGLEFLLAVAIPFAAAILSVKGLLWCYRKMLTSGRYPKWSDGSPVEESEFMTDDDREHREVFYRGYQVGAQASRTFGKSRVPRRSLRKGVA